jgi:hypothetical protein
LTLDCVACIVAKASVAEQHQFYTTLSPAPTKDFYAAPAPAPIPYYIPSQLFKKTKVNPRVGATFSSEFCIIKMVTNMNGKSKKTVTLCDIFKNALMLNIKLGAGDRAASRYGSGSTKIMQLRLRNTG